MKPRPIYAYSILTAALLSVLVLVTLGATRGSGRDVTAAEIDEMKSTIAALKGQVEELEKRLESIEKKGNVIAVPQSVQKLIQNLPRTSVPGKLPNIGSAPRIPGMRPPKIWGKGEYNGWEYYMIPIAGSSQARK